MRHLLVPSFGLLLWSCGATQTHPLLGQWGGDRVQLVVTSEGGSVKLCCASGTLDQALSLDASGHFDVSGTYFFSAGPIFIGGNKPVQARYSGSINGSTMVFLVTTPTGPLGPFTLIFGQAVSFQDCVCPL